MRNYNNTKEASSALSLANKDLSLEFIKMKDHTKMPIMSWREDKRQALTELPESYETYSIITGKIVAIDCDRPKEEGDPDGLKKFIQALKEIGLSTTDLEKETLVVDTPNEGKHFYFRSDEDIVSNISTTLLGKGIDVKATGGLIIGPGSKVRNRKGEIKEYSVSSDTLEIAPLPDEIRDILGLDTKSKPSMSKSTASSNEDTSVVKAAGNKEELFSQLLSDLISSREGERNSTLFKAAARAGSLGIEESIASRLIYAGISIGLSEDESNKTFQSGYSKGLEEYNSLNNSSGSVLSKVYEGACKASFYNDKKLKDIFIEEAKGKFLYHQGSLYTYDRGQWRIEKGNSVIYNYVEAKLSEIAENVTELYSEKELKSVDSKLSSLGDYSKINSVMRSLINAVTNDSADLLDKESHLILAQNCVINLKTGEALEFSPDYYMSCRLGAEYRPEIGTSLAEPYFDFIEPKHKGLLLAFLGQALTGNYGESMLTLTGSGSNGKSLFFQVLSNIFGDYYCYLDSNTFYSKKSDRDSKMTLEGKRLAIVEELCSNPDEIIDADTLKKLIATPSITGRSIYASTKTFDSKVSIIASSNELPTFANPKVAIAEERRLLLASCPYTYFANPSGSKEKKKDHTLEQNLHSSKDVRSSILNAIVENSVEYLKDTPSFISNKTPGSVKALVKDWLYKDKIQEPFLAGFEITGNPLDVVPLIDVYLYFSEETSLDTANNKIGNLLATSKFIKSQPGIEIVRDSRRIPINANVSHYKGNHSKIHEAGAKAYYMKGAKLKEIFSKDSEQEII